MIRIRYKSGWLRFRTIEELSDVTGWSYDRIRYALKTKTAILGVDLAFGQPKPKTIIKPMKKTVVIPPKYQDLKNELRLVKKRKNRSDRIIRRYEQTWFPGRIETNEIKHARNESARLQQEIDRIAKAIDHHKKYERRSRDRSGQAA